MKMKVRELVDAQRSLDKVLNAGLEFKLAYRMKKIAKKIIAEQKHVEDARMELFKKYGELQKEGNYRIIPEKANEFKDEWEKFLDLEVDMDFQKIPYECIRTIGMSAYDIAHLDNFVEEPTEEQLKDEPKK
jgi:hypothetical protein